MTATAIIRFARTAPPPQVSVPAPALAVAIVGVAFALRAYRLAELPPGLYSDEAWNLVDILEMRETGRFPLFFPNNYGREPLFIYLQAAMAAIAGEVTPFIGRLTSAFVGTVTVALLYRFARALFGPGSWTPLVSAAVLTVTFSHLVMSRIGLRVISAPPFSLASFLFFWDAYRFGRWRSFLLGGLFLGLTLDTYLAARLVPLVPLAVMIVALMRRLSLPVGFWRKSTAAAALAVFASAPLIALAIQSPSAIWTRIEVVASLEATSIPHNALAVARMFMTAGDQNLRHNLPGRPLYDPGLGALFVLGLGVSLAAAVSPFRRRLRLPAAWELPAVLVLAWSAVAVLPALISTAPHFLRSLGLVPATALICGFGAEWLRQRLPARRHAVAVLALGVMSLTATASTARDYFGPWAQHADLADRFDVHMLALGAYARAQMESHPVSFDAELSPQGTLRYALRGLPLPRFVDLKTAFVERSDAGVVPTDVEYILFGSTRTTDVRGRGLPPWLQGARSTELSTSGTTTAVALSVWPLVSPSGLASLVLKPVVPQGVSFGGVVAPTGALLPHESVVPGQSSTAALRWRVLRTPSVDYHVSIRLEDSGGRLWAAQDDELGAPSFRSTDWLAGDTVYTAHWLTLPPDAPPGRYSVAITVFGLHPLQNLAIETPAGPRGDLLEIGEVEVAAPSPLARGAMRPAVPLDQRWEGLHLFGYSLDPPAAQAGEPFDLHLFWATKDATDAAVVRLSVEDASGVVVARVEESPLAGAYPFARWSAGDAFHDVHRVLLPARTAAGPSRLTITLLGADGTALGDSLGVSGPEIRTRARRFEAPAGLKPLGAEIGDLASLLGYTAPEQLSAGSWPVTLAWRVVGETERSFAATLQLLDVNGRLVAQHDGPPAEGVAPTTSWLAGEVVVDQRVLTLPVLAPGEYTLIAALYDPATGERLPVRQGGRTDDHVVVASYAVP